MGFTSNWFRDIPLCPLKSSVHVHVLCVKTIFLSFMFFCWIFSFNEFFSPFVFSVLSIHMDDQIDGKTLVGSYVCTERPGEFRWQPGSLTQVFFFIQSLGVHILWRGYPVYLNFPIHRLFYMVIGLSLRILTKHRLMCIPSYYHCWRVQIHL